MYKYLLVAICLFFMVFSCKKTQSSTLENQDVSSKELTEKETSKIKYDDFLLDDKTQNLIVDWDEYIQIQEVLDNLKKADLSFIMENKEVTNATLKDFKKNIPQELNTPSIIARINVFETKFLKLESLANLSSTSKKELMLSIKDVLIAFSNLNLQMNKKVEFDNLNIQKP